MTRFKSISLLVIWIVGSLLVGCSSNPDTASDSNQTVNNGVAQQATNNTNQQATNKGDNKAANTANTNKPNLPNSNSTLPTREKPTGPSPAKADQIIFQNHTSGQGNKPQMGDYITLHLEYYSPKEEVIYSSYIGSPNSFELRPSLFNGVLNKGIMQMAIGDSASFYVPADSIFQKEMPAYIKSGESIRYSIKLLDIKTAEKYIQEKSEEVANAAAMDQQTIRTYLKANKLAAKETKTGLRYIIEKEGSGEPAGTDIQKVEAKYKLSTLETNMVIEDTGNKSKKLVINQQVKGLREALTTFPKGTKVKLIVPSILGHGNKASGRIPPGSVLIYDLEIIDF